MIISELISGGELLTLMQQQKKFEPFDAAIILKQILSAIAFMHEEK
jgi:serine/threonine protein kinase|tara:strand:- start:309 stop:446 length:138 start_codon:yes stop_codon:yes gene_type:complete